MIQQQQDTTTVKQVEMAMENTSQMTLHLLKKWLGRMHQRLGEQTADVAYAEMPNHEQTNSCELLVWL